MATNKVVAASLLAFAVLSSVFCIPASAQTASRVLPKLSVDPNLIKYVAVGDTVSITINVVLPAHYEVVDKKRVRVPAQPYMGPVLVSIAHEDTIELDPDEDGSAAFDYEVGHKGWTIIKFTIPESETNKKTIGYTKVWAIESN